MESIVSVLVGALLSFTGTHHSTLDEQQSVAPVEWSCEALKWPLEPYLDGKILKAQVSAKCQFKGVSGGGFAELEAYLAKRIVDQSEKVHSGPNKETYKDMTSTHFDTTVKVGGKSDYAFVRQDAHVATDAKTALLFDTISKSIEGYGNAKYMKKVDAFTKVTPIADKISVYQGTLVSYFEIEKPVFVPGSIFISEVKKQLEKQAGELEKDLLEDIGQHI